MSRFAADPRWLVYLSPTMSPVARLGERAVLEHREGVCRVSGGGGRVGGVSGEAHGLLGCGPDGRDLEAPGARFGAPGEALGAVWTRTGQPLFTPE